MVRSCSNVKSQWTNWIQLVNETNRSILIPKMQKTTNFAKKKSKTVIFGTGTWSSIHIKGFALGIFYAGHGESKNGWYISLRYLTIILNQIKIRWLVNQKLNKLYHEFKHSFTFEDKKKVSLRPDLHKINAPLCIHHDDVGRGLVCNQISPQVTNNLRDFQWRLLSYTYICTIFFAESYSQKRVIC